MTTSKNIRPVIAAFVADYWNLSRNPCAMQRPSTDGQGEVRDVPRLGRAKRVKLDGSLPPSPRKAGDHNDTAPMARPTEAAGAGRFDPSPKCPVPHNDAREQWIADEIERVKRGDEHDRLR